MKRVNKTINKYLSNYAEPEIEGLGTQHASNIDAILVIPIFDETIEKLNHFLELNSPKSIVIIWVFNCPDTAVIDEQRRTQSVMKHFVQSLNAQGVGQETNVYCSQFKTNRRIYIIDRCSSDRQIPVKQGVGLARKIGLDLGLFLINEHLADEQVWLHNTDADVRLPDNYFNLPTLVAVSEPPCAAIIYPFEHQPEQGYEQSMALYEFSLRYYVGRLAWAGSPYAFHTIGSLIAVNPLAYAQVRGIPKRAGAEDFYLLNKLAKVGTVISLESPSIKIAGRPSHRVPFGTGPALSKLQDMSDSLNDYTYYHPEIFQLLKQVLTIVKSIEYTIGSIEMFFELLQNKMSKDHAKQVVSVLKRLNIEKQYRHLASKPDAAQFIVAFHTWFDAFVTLRFIHEMRDLAYPNIPLDTLKRLLKHDGVKIDYYPRFNSLGV